MPIINVDANNQNITVSLIELKSIKNTLFAGPSKKAKIKTNAKHCEIYTNIINNIVDRKEYKNRYTGLIH